MVRRRFLFPVLVQLVEFLLICSHGKAALQGWRLFYVDKNLHWLVALVFFIGKLHISGGVFVKLLAVSLKMADGFDIAAQHVAAL